MKTVCQQDLCAGCMACVDICPKEAIHIEGCKAYNAVIDPSLCVDCNACRRVCQQNTPPAFHTPIFWKEGWAAEESVRSAGSSGGAAGALTATFLEQGGAVCSCVFADGRFGFRIARTPEESSGFSGSKYVKSDPSGVYPRIKALLQSGTPVLFIGLPCQCAAVQKYTPSELLYTVDLICHGTPAPEVLEQYLRCKGTDMKGLTLPTFRKKQRFALADNHKPFAPGHTRDPYTLAFLNSISYTENCYRCSYARSERVSDLTLGDSWGSKLPAEEAAKGISLILCQTEKGARLLASSRIILFDADPEVASENNHQLRHPSSAPAGRNDFFEALEQNRSFDELVRKHLPKQYFRQKAKGFLFALLGRK